jgi:hypothetical protein
MKMRPVGADFFHADVRADRQDEAKSPFSQFFEKRLQKTRRDGHRRLSLQSIVH